MGAVIVLYRRLIADKVFEPENPPWKESDRYIDFKDSRGFTRSKQVVTTDVSIKVAKQDNPYDGCIDDGGKPWGLKINMAEETITAPIRWTFNRSFNKATEFLVRMDAYRLKCHRRKSQTEIIRIWIQSCF
jgi:hypothetical protein